MKINEYYRESIGSTQKKFLEFVIKNNENISNEYVNDIDFLAQRVAENLFYYEDNIQTAKSDFVSLLGLLLKKGVIFEKFGNLSFANPRYFVDIRVGCGAVRDKWHKSYDEDYPGLHDSTLDVVEYRHGRSDNGLFQMQQEDVTYLNELCTLLNEKNNEQP